jgi:prepilin-type N-terminal cleavage/methylation domain-containing protein
VIKKHTYGLTLVEVIVAMAIIAIVVVSVIAGFMAVQNINTQARQSATEASSVEVDIAGLGNGAISEEEKPLTLNGYSLGHTSAKTYENGGRRYTVIDGG